MKKIITTLRRIPLYGWIAGIVYFVLQFAVYRFSNVLSVLIGTADRALMPKIPLIDDHIPVVAVFVLIYVFSYVFWIMAPIAASLTDKRNFVNYLIGLSVAYLIGAVIFVVMPTCMDREAEGLLEIGALPGFFNQLLGTVYNSDGGAQAFNLFPSYHCLISIYCYLGIRRREEIAKGFRIYSLVMALLICASTVLTKQHYIADVAGGLTISIVCYAVVQKLDPAGKLMHR